jgi:uroporphyrinogen III methyltransferase/synthase
MPRGPDNEAMAKVYLVGAGPGDPELLTVKARRLIQSAECLVYDQLIGPAVLELAPAGCERIFVGKQCGRACRTQAEINEILVEFGRAGRRVVRLKGGDPFIFGRGGEEAQALRQAGVDFEVVPGITAALGAAAACGIPLTHRGVSSAVVFLTGHEDPGKGRTAVKWEDYGRLDATLCIYMGVRNLGAILSRLQAGGLAPDTPAALVEAATTENHRFVLATAATLAARAEAAAYASPAIAIIGPVAANAESLAWFSTHAGAFPE